MVPEDRDQALLDAARSLDLGWRVVSADRSKWLGATRSLVDYCPTSIDPADGIGWHYEFYAVEGEDLCLMRYYVIGQRSFGAPGFVSAAGLVPIARGLAEQMLAFSRNHAEPVAGRSEHPVNDVLKDMDRTIDALRSHSSAGNSPYLDLVHDVNEVRSTFLSGAFRACLAMSGRVLERVLRLELRAANGTVHDDWGVGKLLGELERAGIYADGGLRNIWNLVNAQRIVGVHAREQVPIPSREQACMVVYAVIDMLNRALARQQDDHPG